MKKSNQNYLIFLTILFTPFWVHSQDSAKSNCQVTDVKLSGIYKGDCKKGLANGQGEIIGTFLRYKGSFKNGMPNGLGTYYYADSSYHIGNFQDGVKEGKGETHYVHTGMPDSVVKGYWSGDIFRGKKYITYMFSSNQRFDIFEVSPTNESGNSITFELGSTSGIPNSSAAGTDRGTANSTNSMGILRTGYILKLNDLISPSGSTVKLISEMSTNTKTTVTFQVYEFPITLNGTLSNGEYFTLDLYKAADWNIRMFVNK